MADVPSQKTTQLQTQGLPSTRAAAKALWGAKSLDDVIDLSLSFTVPVEASVTRRLQALSQPIPPPTPVNIIGLISKPTPSCGRTSQDRQFYYVNGRPCDMPKLQKAVNEVYKSFNATQFPLVIADVQLPTEGVDVNVSPDKRTVLLGSEGNLITALKVCGLLCLCGTRELNPSIGSVGECVLSCAFDV